MIWIHIASWIIKAILFLIGVKLLFEIIKFLAEAVKEIEEFIEWLKNRFK